MTMQKYHNSSLHARVFDDDGVIVGTQLKGVEQSDQKS